MTYRGRVENGVVVLEPGVRLREGSDVRVELMPQSEGAAREPVDAQSWGEVFKDLIGAVDGLPQDMADNHNHYIHGAPKE
ncbi:MAG TPA: hypothetical protein VH253_08395 [Phycisphaerae bacterium]|nr:hypothetical protein [Phycisphaerae bacterium]